MRRHGAPGERDLVGSRWHRRGGRRGVCGRVRPPSSWPRRSECRSQKARGRRDGDTAPATRGPRRSGAGRCGERCHSSHCSAAEHDRHGGPRTLHPAGQEHGPLSRAAGSRAWQLCTAYAREVRGSWVGKRPNRLEPADGHIPEPHPRDRSRAFVMIVEWSSA